MRFLSLFVSVLAISSGVSASSDVSSHSTVNNAGGRGYIDMNLEAGRYEPESHAHSFQKMVGEAVPEFKYSQYDVKFGPTMWGTQTADWATCSTGQSQSPVALPNYYKAKADTTGILKKLNPNYGDTLNTGVNYGSLSLVNTGHALQVNLPTTNPPTLTGGAVGNNPYTVLQMHMHGRSEHSIAGARFPLEIHIVHKDLTRAADDPRLLSVVGIMVEESPDDLPNPALLPLSNLALSGNYSSILNEEKVSVMVTQPFSLTNLLPKNLDFYHYNGSLTTPPCSEQVVWHVLTTPITASRAQILALTAPFGDVGNARPTQPLFARQVIVSSFQTTPLNNGASTMSMTLAGVMSVVMAIARMF